VEIAVLRRLVVSATTVRRLLRRHRLGPAQGLLNWSCYERATSPRRFTVISSGWGCSAREDRLVTADPDDARVARALAAGASEGVARVGEADWWRPVLRWLSRGRLGRSRGWPVLPVLGSPWQDTVSPERAGWRQRAAYRAAGTVDSEEGFVFAVDYRICCRCRLGWVEHPYTVPRYARCGVAAAGLAALREEHPGIGWHTLGGHFPSSEPFWVAVGAGVTGGYRQRDLCPHVTAG
jgi:hypothetical protein